MTKLPEIQRKQPRRELREDIRIHLEALGCPEPHLLLASLSAGVDPRAIPGHLGLLLAKCHNGRQNGRPTADDWERLYEYFLEHPEIGAGVVDVDMSLTATIQLMPYLHAKLKSVHVTGELDHKVRVRPLTPEDIATLKQRMEGEF
ncbi:MAG: hypothetical protein KAT00_13365 [Planctomycetes bacterium]|nr:hypothetical protein [Planctomycetota bacterium]